MFCVKNIIICFSILQLINYGKSKISESCFSSVGVETLKVKINLTCGLQNISRINSIIFHRPLERGDSECMGNDEQNECCYFKTTEHICSVYLDQNDEQFENAMQCQHRRSCVKEYKAKYMGNCKGNCKDEDDSISKTCWSRIIRIDYECETQGQVKNESKFKIYLCFLRCHCTKDLVKLL